MLWLSLGNSTNEPEGPSIASQSLPLRHLRSKSGQREKT